MQEFGTKLDADVKRAGQTAGASLGDGIRRGADGRLRDARGHFVAVGKEFGAGMSDGLKEEFPKGLASVGDRIKRWGRGIAGEGRTIGRGIGGHLGDGVKSGVSMMGRSLGTGAKLLTGFAAGGVAALGLVSGAAAVMGGAVASSNEQATISFTTMLRKAGDTEKEARDRAGAFIGDLQKLAATTPFEFADLQSYSSKLVSAGVEVRDIIPMMKNLGDVTSGVGTGSEGIDRATVALQQMIAAGRIQAEDLNQLRDAGIPVYDLLAGATGKSKKEIAELAQTGKLGKKELDQLLETLSSDAPKGLEKFSGLMAKQSGSLKGMWSNLTDTVSQGLGRVGTRAMPELKRSLAGVSGVLSNVFDYLDDHGDDIERIFKSGGRFLRAFGGIARDVLGAFFGSVSDGQDTLTALADWLDTHEEDVTGFFIGAADAGLTFAEGAATAASVALKAYAGLADGVGAALAFILRSQKLIVDAAAGAAYALGATSKGDQLAKVSGQLGGMIEQNAKDDAGAGKARAMADALDNKLIPSLSAARKGLARYGDEAKDAARKGDEWRGALVGITRSVDKNGTSLSENTKKGRANRRSIREAIDALNDDVVATGKSARKKGSLEDAEKAAAKAMRNGTRDIRDQAKKAGLNKDAVDDMIRKIKKTPKEVKTEINFSTNAGKVLVQLKKGTVLSGQGEARGENGGPGKTARGGMVARAAYGGLTGRFMGQLPGHTPLSRGDDMQLPILGGGRQHLRGGEGVQVTEAMDPYEQKRLNAMNHGVNGGLSAARVRQLLGEPVAGAAARGGTVGASAVPASVMDLGPAARDFAVEQARKTAEAYARIMQKQLQGVADQSGGGNTGAALKYARAHVGHPYQFGTLWDCSGFVSALHSIAKGESPHRRYVTPDFHGNSARGFTRGKKSNFMVGVNPSPGKSGHMAATVNGVNVESAGGVGVRVGGGARGYNDGMFSWRGGLAYGGRVRGQTGDMPMDLIARQGQRYSPILADLAAALTSGRGYASGTASAAPGFHWTGEKSAELVVNPQMRRYGGGERVIPIGKDGLGGQSPLIGSVTWQAQGTRSDMQQLQFAVRSLELGRKR